MQPNAAKWIFAAPHNLCAAKGSGEKQLSDFNIIFVFAKEREKNAMRLCSMARKRQPTENQRKQHHQLCIHIVFKMGKLINISAFSISFGTSIATTSRTFNRTLCNANIVLASMLNANHFSRVADKMNESRALLQSTKQVDFALAVRWSQEERQTDERCSNTFLFSPREFERESKICLKLSFVDFHLDLMNEFSCSDKGKEFVFPFLSNCSYLSQEKDNELPSIRIYSSRFFAI